MTKGLIFWIIMLVWFVFFLLSSFVLPGIGGYARFEPVVIFILLLLLGWQVFGRPVQ